MSPEEFDNRLKSSFQDEFLPPKDRLWQNINQRLDQSAAKPFWYWLVPVIVVVSAGIAWLGNGFTKNSGDKTVQTTQGPVESNASGDQAVSDNSNLAGNDQPSGYDPANIQDVSADGSRTNQENTAPSYNSKENNSVQSTETNRNPRIADAENTPEAPRETYGRNSETSQMKENTGQDNAAVSNNNRTKPSLIDQYGELFRLSIAGYPLFRHRYVFEKDEPILAFESPANPLKSTATKPKKSGYRSNFNSADLDSKWWFSFGGGPQLSLNTASVKSDSQAYIHKDLWANRSKMTRNGSGFNTHALVSYKIGKKFFVETGLNYSLRTEDIRFNETSYAIAARDSQGMIQKYLNLKIFIIIPKQGGGHDTTFYDAVSNFSLAVKNKYNVVTVPFKVGFEQPLSENTFLSASAGAGLSMITSSNYSHYDMVREVPVKVAHSTRFSGSFNGNLSLYTNFNDVGQMGLYTGFQMYTQPWKVNNGQYAIRMSDLQFGIVFRKPL